MASIDFSPKLRPRVARGKKGWFHCWCHVSEIVAPSNLRGGHSGGVIATTLGLVEDEDGNVRKVYPEEITFLEPNKVEDLVDSTDALRNQMLYDKALRAIIFNSIEEKEKKNAEN